jgi:hypothetical protein
MAALAATAFCAPGAPPFGTQLAASRPAQKRKRIRLIKEHLSTMIGLIAGNEKRLWKISALPMKSSAAHRNGLLIV